ncbi:UNVERIFIED_CONTAM: protein TRM32 [Sesamum radiatum]|uniref:Protein TRM32 n=1 Tax=Sesamum radiatum TaxID=300843 RepID=A0AAW2VCV9_SESRA
MWRRPNNVFSNSVPRHSPVNREVQDSDSVIDKMERPSPVSVLEPLFTDDDISPGSSVSQPVQNEIEPRHIHFEEQSSFANDQGICLRISLEDEESAFEYVEAVLLGSGLNWDEFLLRWLSLDEILDSSLFDEVELFSSRPRHDQKLLFDSANEVLKEVCESYFGCFIGISHVNRNTRPVPKGMDLIQEIWRLVEMHLSQCQQPHSLDQLVKRDLARSGKWMNLQSDIKLIGLEIEETIFNELVDTVLDFAGDASECEFEAPQAESKAIEKTSL